MRTVGVEDVEFWPDFGRGPLWHPNGTPADPVSLGVDAQLARRLTDWNERYAETHLPIDGSGNAEYLAEGARLLREVRARVGARYRVVVTEPWWGEEPDA